MSPTSKAYISDDIHYQPMSKTTKTGIRPKTVTMANMSLPNELYATLEKARGRIPRTRFVADILYEYFSEESYSEVQKR